MTVRMVGMRTVGLVLLTVVAVWGGPLETMLVLEATPGTEQAIGLIRPRVFQEGERAGVVGYARTAQMLQPLTADRDALAEALRRAGVRVVVGVGGAPLDAIMTVDVTGAIRKACDAFGPQSEDDRRAVVVWFQNEDPRLGANLDGLKTRLRAAGARLYAIVIPRAPTAPNALFRTGPAPAPVMTAQYLSDLAAASGGRIFRQHWDLEEILEQARRPKRDARP